MNHRQILDAALASLPAAHCRHLNQVADEIDRDPRFAERQHLLYPVLARAAPTLEPLLPPAEMAGALAGFLDRHGMEVAATLYSRAYIQTPGPALQRLATELAGWVAIATFDALAAGRVAAPAPVSRYTFHSDQDDFAFPYEE